ncbi:DNA-directed RNA polymerase subunit H [Candidatus Geothermarchaeota archaeon]|nr:MAG: DNA-directed RNA polymerase subunit H [Candidatus Geothermarchaeota archaeon]
MTDKEKVRKSFSVFDHVLVPKHEIVPKEEAERIIEKYGGKAVLFPLISSNDPAVIALGAKPGDLIRIIRRSPTGKTSIYYRLVIRE